MPSFSLFSSSGPGRPGHRGGGPTASTPLLGRLGRGANDNAPLRPRQSQLGLLSTYLGSRAVAGGASGGGGGGGWGAGGGWGSLGGPGGRGSVHVGYGALVASQLAQEANEEEEQEAARRALERRARTRARQRRFEGAWSDSDSSDDSSSESGSDDEDHDGGRLWLRLPGRVRRRSGFPKLRIRKRAGRVADWARRTVRDLWVEPRQGAVKKVVDVWWSRWGVLVILPAALVCVRLEHLGFGSSSLPRHLLHVGYRLVRDPVPTVPPG